MGSLTVTNIIFFLVILTIFIILFTSPTVHGFVTPSPQQRQNSNIFTNRRIEPTNNLILEPILITPSNIKIIEPKIDLDEQDNVFITLSPGGSVVASSLPDVNMEFIKEVKAKPSYTFSETGRNFGANVGEKITCKVFEEFLGRQVLTNIRPDFLKNPYGKNPKYVRNLELDMFDPITNIAIEYNGVQHYKYVSSMHKDEEDFEYQKIKDEFKIKRCKEVGVKLIVVPYTVDTGYINKDGKFVTKYKGNEYREEKLRNFLLPKLEALMSGKDI